MTGVFDFHTHVLPGIDDGSRNVEESLAMLRELASQGASGIAATPHFYAQRTTPESFFTRRNAAWEQLRPFLDPGIPEIRLGAEVLYFEGINHYDGIEQFCLDGTGLLLLEMPLCTWTARMISAVLEINSRGAVTVLLAHIERYLPYRNDKAWEQLLEHGVLIQASASFFIDKRWTATRLLKKDKIHLLGTDSHNMGNRKPNLAQAVDIISRKSGAQLLRKLTQTEAMVLNDSKNPVDRRRRGSGADMFVDLL